LDGRRILSVDNRPVPGKVKETMKTSLLNSRRFWLAIADAVVSLATLAITFYLSSDTATRAFVLGILAVLQPVFVAVINGLTAEDTANINAQAVRDAAKIQFKGQ
jgi:hypothetical protein